MNVVGRRLWRLSTANLCQNCSGANLAMPMPLSSLFRSTAQPYSMICLVRQDHQHHLVHGGIPRTVSLYRLPFQSTTTTTSRQLLGIKNTKCISATASLFHNPVIVNNKSCLKNPRFIINTNNTTSHPRNFSISAALRNASNSSLENEDDKKLSIPKRLVKLTKDYWYIVIPVHILNNSLWFIGFVAMIYSGIDLISWMEWSGVFPDSVIEKVKSPSDEMRQKFKILPPELIPVFISAAILLKITFIPRDLSTIVVSSWIAGKLDKKKVMTSGQAMSKAHHYARNRSELMTGRYRKRRELMQERWKHHREKIAHWRINRKELRGRIPKFGRKKY